MWPGGGGDKICSRIDYKLHIQRKKNLEMKNVCDEKYKQSFQYWLDGTIPIMGYAHKFFLPKIQNSTAKADMLKEELKEMFPKVFSDGLGRCPSSLSWN